MKLKIPCDKCNSIMKLDMVDTSMRPKYIQHISMYECSCGQHAEQIEQEYPDGTIKEGEIKYSN